jgi:hypothetical protein
MSITPEKRADLQLLLDDSPQQLFFLSRETLTGLLEDADEAERLRRLVLKAVDQELDLRAVRTAVELHELREAVARVRELTQTVLGEWGDHIGTHYVGCSVSHPACLAGVIDRALAEAQP